ncbi:RNA polymerase II-associated protein 3-like [Amphiura filiformis]|uniref:RNA polymerase II-associated protein 3-like n=1 Tax=Amphiura filiformis TaxID=82378 RepID=UPI003B21E14D
MSEKKFFELQQQVRRDNDDHQDFLRDLNNWEKDIKRKDDDLRQKPATSEERILPPVRNREDQLHQKQTRKKKKAEVVEKRPPEEASKNGNDDAEEKKKRIRAYDYRSWDKFDVDKACAEVDGDEADRESSDTTDYETDSDAEREFEERRRKVQEAIAEKDKGNALFKEGKYDQAVICYTAGMEADPSNGILPANRAMALLKLKRYSEAEADCNKAISLDCTYVKAYSRRGAARIELGKLEEANKDFKQVLNLEASNKQARSEIKRIDKLLKEQEDRRKEAQEPSNIVQAVEKPIHLRSSKPLKRITIEEIGTGCDNEVDSPRPDATTSQEQDNKDSTNSDTSKISSNKSPRVAGVNRISTLDTTTKDTSSRKTKAESSSEPIHRASSPPSIPPVPHSSFQLQADIKKLDRHPQLMYQYFKQISPEKLPELFQQSLDSTMLMKILVLLQQHYIPNQTPVYAVLKHLTKVKRFDMNVLFMSKKEKQVVADLVEYCKTSKSQTDEEVRTLAKKYAL